jgi:hypothetical protein
MNLLYKLIYPSCCIMASTAFALDDFNVQANKIAHEETSWRHDVYTTGRSMDLWKSDWEWFQQPALTVRLSSAHRERSILLFTPSGPQSMTSDSDIWTPMLSGSFQTVAGINVGVTYGRTIQTLDSKVAIPSGSFVTVEAEDQLDSVGGYVSKQWDCGLNLAGTWSYTWTDGERFFFREFDTVGASGALGFARSFGEKTFGRNIFVDTSANFFFENDDVQDLWHFVWMAKVGHNFCPAFSVYGLFNLFHELERESPGFDFNSRDYYPLFDETWGEAGGGLQTQFGEGFSLMAEAATPILDEGITSENAFQVRAALNWRF